MTHHVDDEILRQLKTATTRYLPLVRDLRRSIHAEPELALNEHRTREKIAQTIAGTALQVWQPLIETDLVADLKGPGDRSVLLRADIDALPLQEETSVPHKSTAPGVMHACGHDGHAAILTGAALVLSSLRDHLPNSVRFVFQPAEELVCAGEDLVKAGVCSGIDAAYALHAWPGLPTGTVACKEGPIFAAADHFEIWFRGKGCHGAMPEKGNNPITPAAKLAVELHALHERENAVDGSVISVGSLRAGTTGNIIPDEAVLRGTMRHLTVERGDELVLKISSAAEKVAAASYMKVEITHERKYSLPVTNSRGGNKLVRDLAVKYLGKERFVEVDRSSMGAEDFAFYLEGRDGALFRLGMGKGSPGVHTPRFDFNDDALETGILMFSLIALSAA